MRVISEEDMKKPFVAIGRTIAAMTEVGNENHKLEFAVHLGLEQVDGKTRNPIVMFTHLSQGEEITDVVYVYDHDVKDWRILDGYTSDGVKAHILQATLQLLTDVVTLGFANDDSIKMLEEGGCPGATIVPGFADDIPKDRIEVPCAGTWIGADEVLSKKGKGATC